VTLLAAFAAVVVAAVFVIVHRPAWPSRPGLK